jgi:hypothetical protein
MPIFHSHGLQAGLPKNAGQKKTSAGESNSGAKSKQRRRHSAKVCGQTFNLRRPRKQTNLTTGLPGKTAPAFGWRARH